MNIVSSLFVQLLLFDLMASCAHPEERVDPMCDDDDDSNASGDEVQTPSGKEMASASRSRTTSLSKHLNLACKRCQMVVDSSCMSIYKRA
ncbi:hypothetical protein Bca52824_076940 [Brassica carinata]|uniref:Secreted protein n=1 Tax=Brassica carinata TaxID=52824 RepID=A0A8X7TZJ1_BRACI|nr:hypothetical protein Bca52824_076940 [Brassica carinata]